MLYTNNQVVRIQPTHRVRWSTVFSNVHVPPGRRNLTRHAGLLPSIRQRNLHKGSDLRIMGCQVLAIRSFPEVQSFLTCALCRDRQRCNQQGISTFRPQSFTADSPRRDFLQARPGYATPGRVLLLDHISGATSPVEKVVACLPMIVKASTSRLAYSKERRSPSEPIHNQVLLVLPPMSLLTSHSLRLGVVDPKSNLLFLVFLEYPSQLFRVQAQPDRFLVNLLVDTLTPYRSTFPRQRPPLQNLHPDEIVKERLDSSLMCWRELGDPEDVESDRGEGGSRSRRSTLSHIGIVVAKAISGWFGPNGTCRCRRGRHRK
jgi:hypothetical protein